MTTGFTIIDNDIITSNISNGSFRLYCLLTSMCYGNKTECFPSQKYMAEKLNKSIRQIQRYLQELIDAKLIQIKRRGSISNLYMILAKKVQQVGQKVTNTIKKAYNAYTSNKKDTFSNYSQRNYSSQDFADMEKALLGLT